MALTAADLDTLDRAIASGVLTVRGADGRQVSYRTMDDLMRARALVAGETATATSDPTTTPGGVTYAEWGRD